MAFDWGNAFQGGATGALGGAKIGAELGSSFGPWGAGIGGVLGALGGIFSGKQNRKSDKEINSLFAQMPDQLKQYIMPYINAGNNALGSVGNEYSKILGDPNSIIKQIGAGYQKSPGYDFQLNQGENAINNAAAAGGMIGTGQHQQQAGELAENLANKDYGDFVNRSLGLYTTGLSGQQGLANLGQQSSSDLGVSLANILKARAELEQNRQSSKNKENSGFLSGLFSF